MMEELDAGFTLAHHIKQVDDNIPIIIVTGVAQETGMRFFSGTEEEKGWTKADTILSKPIRFEQLLQEIKKLLAID
jgi:CheY-like chemotaxis protein